MHNEVNNLIKNQNYKCYNDGSYQHYATAFHQLTP